MEYAEEPRLVFSPLSEKDYCTFYDLEMQDYSADIPYYLDSVTNSQSLLELGCGGGRLTQLLAPHCKDITGLDISREMISLAQQRNGRGNITYHCGDMRDFTLNTLFDTIIIPYNTLNLLTDLEEIASCLRRCRNHLCHHATLLLHLYHPDKKMIETTGEKVFQFRIFEDDSGGKLIKETLKSFDTTTDIVTLEERYRVRPFSADIPNRDLKHILHLCCPGLETWSSLLAEAGFGTLESWGGFDFSPFCPETGTTLLIRAHCL